MRALPHLLARLHRRLALQMLRTRASQLDMAIEQAELHIVRTHDELAVLRAERAAVQNRLRLADAHPHRTTEPSC